VSTDPLHFPASRTRQYLVARPPSPPTTHHKSTISSSRTSASPGCACNPLIPQISVSYPPTCPSRPSPCPKPRAKKPPERPPTPEKAATTKTTGQFTKPHFLNSRSFTSFNPSGPLLLPRPRPPPRRPASRSVALMTLAAHRQGIPIGREVGILITIPSGTCPRSTVETSMGSVTAALTG
jgi:hypothetical protein